MRRRQIYQMQQAAREAALFVPPSSPVAAIADGVNIVIDKPLPLDPHACTKCGRIVGRGRIMHEKHCKA